MIRSASPLSDHDDNADNALQEEYEKLLSQLRVAKLERIKYINQTNCQLAKCENEFKWLQQENENLRLELSIIESDENKKKDARLLGGLKSSADAYNKLLRQMEQHKQISLALDIDIKKCENRLKKLCSQETLSLADLEAKLKTKKQIIENKLEKANKNLGELLVKNNRERTIIGNIRNQRHIYSKAMEKLQKTLKQINLNKSTLIKAALEAYEQREEARKKCAAYIEKNERESSLFESEIRDLSRNIDHEKQLFKFMQEKGKERSTELPESAKIKKERKARNEKHLQIQKLASEEEALHRIQQALGETKLENIVEKFRKTQEENYALFKYVNEQNAQIEEIKELIGKYKQEKKEQKISHKTILESFHQKMRTYEKEYISSKKARENAEQSLQVVRAELKVIQTEVEGLFRAAQCPLEAVTDPLLPSEIKISQENLLIYLTAVENRVDDLLKLRSLRGKNKTNDPESSQVSENETSQSNQKTYTFSVPSARTDAGAISDDSGADFRLLTHEEIKQIIIKS